MATDRLALVLTLAGSRTSIYGGQGTYTPAQPAAYPAAYPSNAFNGLKVSGYTSLKEALPKIGGVGKPSSISLTVFDRADKAALLFGPDETGVETAILSSTVVAENGTATITADGDISGFPAEGYLYVGQETMYYTSKVDGTGVFTLHANGRGALGSLAREHLRDNHPARSFKPVISAQPLNWAHRGAVLSLHRVFENGVIETASQFELLRGTLRMHPTPNDADNSFTLQLVSALAKFDRVVGTGLELTKLVDGFFYSDGMRGCKTRHYDYLPEGTLATGGLRVAHAATAVKAAGVGAGGTITINDNQTHEACFGTARGNNPGDPSNGRVRLLDSQGGTHDAEDSVPSGYGGGAVKIVMSVDNMHEVTADAVNDGRAIVTNAAKRRNQDGTVTLAAGLHRWPEAYVKLFNEQINTTGADPKMHYCEATLSSDGTRLQVVDSGYRFDHNNPPRLGPLLQEPHASRLWYPLFRLTANDPIDNGIDQISANRWQSVVPRSLEVAVQVRAQEARVAYYQYAAPATAFWQGGRYLLIQDNVLPFATVDHPHYLRALRSGTHEHTGIQLETIIQYDEVVSQNDSDGNFIGYRVRVTDYSIQQFNLRNRSTAQQGDGAFGPFGNWTLDGGRSEAQLSAYAELKGDPRIIILQLMLSGFGGVEFPNATYSVLPRAYGLSMDPAEVDIDGIRAFGLPRGSLQALSAFRQEKPLPAKTLLEGILRAMSAALVMANIGGTQKITLVEVRSAFVGRAVATIADRDWIGKARPGSGFDDVRQSSWQLEVNWSNSAQKFLRTPEFHDADVIDAKGGAQSASIKLSIRGLVVDEDLELRNIFQQLRHKYGRTKKLFKGEVSWSKAKAFGVGQVVLVTANRGISNTGARGVFSVPMQITALSWNPISRRCAVELVFDATQFGGYAPVATVDSVVDVDTLEMSSNVWSLPAYSDWMWLLENKETLPGGGVPCECVHVGEEENNTLNTITGVDTGLGNFTVVAHGLAAGDSIRVGSWDLTPDYLKVFVHLLTDGDTGLGVANDPPFRFG